MPPTTPPIRHAYPVMLDVSDRLVVIVGGGSVAVRKAAGLIDAGATRVRCVAPEFAPDLPEQVERVVATYDARHLDGAALVFAATNDPAVNGAVVRDARARGAWVNRADAQAEPAGDFATPALLRKGTVSVTVSAAGNPALAVKIRDGIAGRWDDRWSRMAEVAQQVRAAALGQGPMESGRRTQLFRDLATEPALAALDEGGVDAVTRWLRERYPELELPCPPAAEQAKPPAPGGKDVTP